MDGAILCTTLSTNMLKAYLRAQAFFSAQQVVKKPCRRKPKTKVCGSKSAIFVILPSLLITMFNNDNSKKVQVLTVILAQN